MMFHFFSLQDLHFTIFIILQDAYIC
uniref:Uncharacterized protein n=1 Tax=Arundo donax TaxID=35708 RepID=A0A0A9B0L6_ARUDO